MRDAALQRTRQYKVGAVKEARQRLSFVRVAAPLPRPSPASGRGRTPHLMRTPTKTNGINATRIFSNSFSCVFPDANHTTRCAPSPACGGGLGWGRRLFQIPSHRHLAVPHRRAGGQRFRRIDDGVGVDAVVAVEVADGAGLAEMLDAERFDAMPAHAAEP